VKAWRSAGGDGGRHPAVERNAVPRWGDFPLTAPRKFWYTP